MTEETKYHHELFLIEEDGDTPFVVGEKIYDHETDEDWEVVSAWTRPDSEKK